MTTTGDDDRQPTPTPAANTWTVESIAGVPTTDPKPQLSLGPEGRLSGTTGVNRMFGTYEALDETIRIEGVGMTRMAGPAEAMEQEGRFLRALEGWNAFHVKDGTLTLGLPETGLVLSQTPRE